MKRILTALSVAAALTLSLSSCGNVNTCGLLSSAATAAKAATLTDAQVQNYVHQYIEKLDAQSYVLPEDDHYTIRLRKLTSGLNEVDGLPLNFKVYYKNEINAFACADGSVRVYTGIMDTMTDDELLGVIGHEIGHVALKHSKKEMQNAILTSAAMQGLGSTGTVASVLTSGTLGAIGQKILNAKYSRKQEAAADDYGYEFLKKKGKNPWSLGLAFEKIAAAGSSGQSNAMYQLFSSHPDTQSRIETIEKRAKADGYSRPANN